MRRVWADLTACFLFWRIALHGFAPGAGGAARAVAYALLRSGWKVIIAARRVEQAQELIKNFSGTPEKTSLEAIYLPSSGIGEWKVSRGVALIVNTTPVGMSPHTNFSPWPQDIRMPEGAFVYDLVYNPAQTLLVRQARQSGLMAASGLGMLVEQAALAFELWTGLIPERKVMYQAASQHLG
jgi:shikimate dehydrogenase